MPPKGGARQSIKVKAVSEHDEHNTFTFPSLQAATKALGIKGHTIINKVLNTERAINGYKFYTLTDIENMTYTTQQQAEDVKKLFGDAKIRHTVHEPILISVTDIIKYITGTSNPHVSFSRLHSHVISQIELTYHQFSGRYERPIPVIKTNKLNLLVSTIVANARLSTKEIQAWATKLGCSTEDIINSRVGPVECDMIEIIQQSFSMFHCIQQHKVLQYYVDMYIPEYNICIECDEDDHERYDQQKEAERQASITATLSTPENPVKWVRFNPNSPEFSIGHVIHEIAKHIFCLRKQDKTHALREKELETQKLQLQLEIEKRHTQQLQAEVERLRLMLQLQGKEPVAR
jgi:very-short-patch-repair endonuclease